MEEIEKLEVIRNFEFCIELLHVSYTTFILFGSFIFRNFEVIKFSKVPSSLICHYIIVSNYPILLITMKFLLQFHTCYKIIYF